MRVLCYHLRVIAPRRAPAVLVIVLFLGACLPRACNDEPKPQASAERPAAPTITLRYRPLEKLGYREHWVYDIAVPGTGVGRNALSLDVELLAKLDQDSFAVRQTIHKHRMWQDGKELKIPSMVGASLTYAWRHDHSLASEISAEAKTPEIAAIAKLTAQLARFGTLIEYPDQAVAISDSWSIEPQRLLLVPGLEATLRPSYTLQAIEKQGLEREAVIATDIQVDVVPVPVSEGITVEGGGTASGTLRVRVRDGVLLEAHSIMHFSQEITVQGSEILGYREFSATAHVFTTPAGAEPDLATEPYSVEKPEDDRECDLQIASALQRIRTTPSHQRAYLASALRGLTLPIITGGDTIEEPGAGVVLSPDGKRIEVDGDHVEPKDLPRALRSAPDSGIIYVYADATTPIDRLRGVLALLPPSAAVRLAVRNVQVLVGTPKNARWQDERLSLALAAATKEEREKRLNDLLISHLMLCEPALLACQKALTDPSAWSGLEAAILRAYLDCGCTATHLEGLEATLQAIFGSPDMRALPLPKLLDEKLVAPLTVADLAKQLTSPSKPKLKAPTAPDAGVKPAL